MTSLFKRTGLATVSMVVLSQVAFAQPASVETRPPNASDQTPAFEGQTRAPQPETLVDPKADVIAEGLPHLWSLEFLPDGRMLVTAKRGTMHVVSPDGAVVEVAGELPEVDASGQGGLLDVALANDFETSGKIYFSFAEKREGGNGTSVAAGTLTFDDAGAPTLSDVSVIFRQMPTYNGRLHYGSRIVPNDDGTLYVTVGERSDAEVRGQAQELESGLGKVFRINADGSAVEGNPFIGEGNALPEIWSSGHRNVQGATLDGEGRLWTIEHGARGGDELNRPEAGKNYGWPDVAYGIEYNGNPIGEGVTSSAETQQPIYYWDPVIAPSGMDYYDGSEFPEWEGAFIIAGLMAQGVVVVHTDGDRVTTEQRVPLNARVRDVKTGPDGAVYAVTENPGEGSSTIVRLSRGE
ncbi:MAG: PQQ-dependent sugar dehydrogenase [Phyllobacteriaceae bacterium]|nr:PQQ-dependent sugar dehydrogenase [Phyllobacteriaceae bacterium]